MLSIWFGIYIFELLLFNKFIWKTRAILVPILIIGIVLTSIQLALTLKPIFAFWIIVFGLFRIINLMRILKKRMHEFYLLHTAKRTSLVLFLLLASVFYVQVLLQTFLTIRHQLFALIIFQLIAAVIIFVVSLNNARKLAPRKVHRFLSDHDLPTVTVAIPARNETTELEQCLRSVLRSDYPKLEIIVLDDCSHVKTSEIIKAFAHDGVRFVKGDEPQNRWLAKNQAYHKLYQQSKGQVILFMGVDVRLGRSAIRTMVNTMFDRQKAMLSVLPTRTKSDASSAIFQPMRYWWELTPPRRLFNRPPVLSSCWIIDRDFLKSLGGFASVSHAILPEAYFAREAVISDSYSFMRAYGELDVQTIKSLKEQRDTVLRVRYPQLRRRLENVLLVSTLEVTIFLLPLFLIIYYFEQLGLFTIFPVITIILLSMTHVVILKITSHRNLVLGMLTFPFAAVAELIAGYASMFTYEFGTVTWKDRNVCIPVMHAIPKQDFLANGNIK